MANPRKIRGEYRPIYVTLFNGKDYRALSPDAKLALLTLKGLCGAEGLRVWPALAESLAELTGVPTPRMKRAIVDLSAARWLEYENGVVWIIRGLEFEPQVSHGATHRKWLQEIIRGMPRVPIIARFCEHYAVFFTDSPSGTLPSTPSDTPSDGSQTPHAIPNHSPQSLSLTPTLTQSAVHSPQHDSVLLLTRAANKGIAERYGEQSAPIHYGHSGAIPCVEALASESVDLDFAAAVIFAYASTLTLERPPRSLKYFTQHVIDRWREHTARRDATAFHAGTVANAPEVDQMRTFAIRYAREGLAEWQAYCDDRTIEWKPAA